jgi:hypothetical protein
MTVIVPPCWSHKRPIARLIELAKKLGEKKGALSVLMPDGQRLAVSDQQYLDLLFGFQRVSNQEVRFSARGPKSDAEISKVIDEVFVKIRELFVKGRGDAAPTPPRSR